MQSNKKKVAFQWQKRKHRKVNTNRTSKNDLKVKTNVKMRTERKGKTDGISIYTVSIMIKTTMIILIIIIEQEFILL